MTLGYRPGTGTISVVAGSTTVTGIGTFFTLEAMVGGTFEFAGLIVRIAAIVSDTELILALPWPGATIAAGAAFVFGQLSGSAALSLQVSADVRSLLERLNLKGEIHYVTAAPLGSLGDDGDTAFDTATKRMYRKSGGAWSLVWDGVISSSTVTDLVVLTQAAFDALPVKDPNTLYGITA